MNLEEKLNEWITIPSLRLVEAKDECGYWRLRWEDDRFNRFMLLWQETDECLSIRRERYFGFLSLRPPEKSATQSEYEYIVYHQLLSQIKAGLLEDAAYRLPLVTGAKNLEINDNPLLLEPSYSRWKWMWKNLLPVHYILFSIVFFGWLFYADLPEQAVVLKALTWVSSIIFIVMFIGNILETFRNIRNIKKVLP